MIKIREATLNDVEQLAVLFDGYRVFYKKESNLQAAVVFLTERIKNKESVIFIAENKETHLTGFVQLYPLFSSTRMKRLWLLNDLYVHPGFRGRQISVLLLNKAKQHAAETNSCGLMLETAKSNTIGNQLYPKTGFTLDTDHNNYYWDV